MITNIKLNTVPHGVEVEGENIFGEKTKMTLPTTIEKVEQYFQGVPYIQEHFPELSADEREFLLTGLTPEEFNYCVDD